MPHLQGNSARQAAVEVRLFDRRSARSRAPQGLFLSEVRDPVLPFIRLPSFAYFSLRHSVAAGTVHGRIALSGRNAPAAAGFTALGASLRLTGSPTVIGPNEAQQCEKRHCPTL
jgi:hypothetical protein